MGVLILATDKQVIDAYILLVKRFEQWQRCQPKRFHNEFSSYEAQLENTLERKRTWEGYCQARDSYWKIAVIWMNQPSMKANSWTQKQQDLNQLVQSAFHSHRAS